VTDRRDQRHGWRDEAERISAPPSNVLIAGLIGRLVETDGGKRLGRVQDVEVVRDSGGYRVEALELGRHGWLDRLHMLRPIAKRIPGPPDPRLVRWASVERLQPGRVVLRAGAPEAE
jgi:sporulation protein YlmC with PRC-barrel domain